MADTPIKQPDNKEAARLRIKSIKENVRNYAGKDNMNPDIWLRVIIAPLEQALDTGDPSAAGKILAIPVDVKPDVSDHEKFLG